VLYALAGSGAIIGLPQIVEMEVDRVLAQHAEDAVDQLRKSVRLLRQLSGMQMSVLTAPNAGAIREGIAGRWKSLEGLLARVPFTHDHATSALHRIIAKTPPCGENNEQFRDCCIWEAGMELAATAPVHLVTNDSAFYEGRDRTRSLAKSLIEEAKARGCDIRLYPSLKEFLVATSGTTAALDETMIGEAIIAAVAAKAEGLAQSGFVVGSPSKPRISGYATPKPSVVAVSFEIRYPLVRPAEQEIGEGADKADLRIEGTCSYDPNTGDVSDIEVRSWHHSLPGYGKHGFGGTSWMDPKTMRTEYDPARLRRID
jgi:hypothetical protein